MGNDGELLSECEEDDDDGEYEEDDPERLLLLLLGRSLSVPAQ